MLFRNSIRLLMENFKNVYKISSHKDLEEIQRIVRIFKISQSQEIKHRLLSIKNLATFKLVMSNN